MQLCKTGDQPYSDPSPNGECSLVTPTLTHFPHFFAAHMNTHTHR